MPSLRTVEVPFELVERARAGEQSAQERIYRSLARPVYTMLRRLVVRPAIAEELLQDVFVEILRSLPSFQASGCFVGWVRSIAVSKALMYLRSPWHRRLTWLDSDDETWAGLGASDEAPFDSDLARALGRLSPSSRAVVWLHDVEEMTHWEIAHLFGRTVSFSKSQLARAHQELRRLLDDTYGELACREISLKS